MKAIVCELCGSNDIIKENGVYVCKHCGTKYTLEEARKLMFDGPVDVQGTVTVDNSSLVEKSLINARRAKQKEDWEETEKYYNIVEQNDPSNIEAIFYSSYGKAKASLINAEFFQRQATFNVLKNSISVVDDNFDMEDEEKEKALIIQMSTDLRAMVLGNFVYNTTTTTNSYGTTKTDDSSKTYDLFADVVVEFSNTLLNIIKKYEAANKTEADYDYINELLIRNITMLTSSSFNCLSDENHNIYTKAIESHKRVNPEFVIPEDPFVARKRQIQQANETNAKNQRSTCLCIFVIIAIIFVVCMVSSM